MLIDRQALKILKVASTDPTRPVLQGLHINGGHAEATNGHVLARVALPATPVEGCPEAWKGAGDSLEGKLLDPQDLKEVDRALQKQKGILPILSVAAIGHAENGLQASWGLEGQVYAVREIEGSFPDIERVIPTGKPTLQVAIAAKYLRMIADLAEKDGRVIFTFRQTKGEVPYIEGVEFQCGGDRPIDGLVMPLRL